MKRIIIILIFIINGQTLKAKMKGKQLPDQTSFEEQQADLVNKRKIDDILMKNQMEILKSQNDEDQEKLKKQFEFDQFGNIIRNNDLDLEELKDKAKDIQLNQMKYKDEFEQKDKVKPIYMIKRNKKNQQYIQDRYKQNKRGQDYYEEIMEGDVYIKRVQSPFEEGLSEKDYEMKKVVFKVNTKNLYYLKKDSYRNVLGGMNLLSIVTNSDNCQYGYCCQNIGEIEQQSHKLKDQTLKLSCFTIRNSQKTLLICDDTMKDTKQWRKSIIQQIVDSYLNYYNLRPVSIPEEKLNPCDNMLYNWLEQAYWRCPLCQNGRYQSPVLIVPEQTILIPKEKIQLQYKMTVVNSILVNPRMKEKQVYNNFGAFRHISKLQKRVRIDTFKVEKIQVKFPNEHKVLGENDIIGELLFTGTTEDGDMGILSVFMKLHKDDDQNEVLEMLKYDLWDPNIDQCINTQFSVFLLLKQIKSHCYYWYKGSLSSPPCTENVDRFILKYPIYISSQQHKAFRKHILKKEDGDRNNRDVKQLFGRPIYELRDCIECEIPQEEPEMEYVRVDQTQVKYAVANKDNYFPFKWHNNGREDPISLLNNDVRLETVERKDVPRDIRQVLDFKFSNLEDFIRKKYDQLK